MSGQDLQVLPSEWAPQSGVMLTWPHSHSDWQPWLAQVEPVYVEIAGQILKREKLLIVCYDDQHMDHILELLRHGEANTSQLKCYVVPSNDTWSRDHGPITVIREGLPRLLDFTFNGWGGKYAAELDDQITSNMHRAGAFGTTPIEKIDMVLEGGSIEVNGAGSLLTTSRCLLSTKRNPNMGRSQIESELSRLFGVGNFLWLENGYLAGDDTDSHIDNLARFCAYNTIAYSITDDTRDEHFTCLKAMEQELKNFRNESGQPFQLIPLPLPQAKFDGNGKRLPASYANFLIVNDAVLVPTYNDPADEHALTQLRHCFPEREVIGINCLPLVYQYGSLHCISMQLPAGVF